MSGISPLRPVIRRRRGFWHRHPRLIAPTILLTGVAVSWPWWGRIV